ncbi:hypothetical protein L873DRAFT_217089 [Choiromyces venosus 120613-1]|uniref:Uncharacterized protein n=1 Tax=Choiromyces venosus 120613-1 TaxID=1336337 RepID=A0A3N4J519_9PEZI|nr:hypothetical protein L873DRAFT_217089 [Choiromyces venosus 120613-1]
MKSLSNSWRTLETYEKQKEWSGFSKKMIITEMASQIPSKPAVKVGYKYNNLMKSYRVAAKLNNQSR